ncbi:MAG: homoserine kinase, partial [Saezia sp.]
MAVFTQITEQEAQAFIEPFQIGKLVSLKGISSGIENTNYFVTTDQNEYVLTIFERLTHQQLPFYLELMRHLAAKNICVPAPQAHQTGSNQGGILHTLKGKPAALVSKLTGRSQLKPQAHHCAQLGHELARMHLAGQDFSINQPNLRGLPWMGETIPKVLPHLDDQQSELIQSELLHQYKIVRSSAYQSLPRGPVHADLFRDNAMFDGDSPEDEHLSGIFDFYFAGVDTFLFDIAVCLNDWCIDLASGKIDTTRAIALLNAYQAQRALNDAERELLPDMLRAGALRFWTS